MPLPGTKMKIVCRTGNGEGRGGGQEIHGVRKGLRGGVGQGAWYDRVFSGTDASLSLCRGAGLRESLGRRDAIPRPEEARPEVVVKQIADAAPIPYLSHNANPVFVTKRQSRICHMVPIPHLPP